MKKEEWSLDFIPFLEAESESQATILAVLPTHLETASSRKSRLWNWNNLFVH